ncbi:chaperonin GroL, partial [Chlamydia psittaci 08DC60]
IADIPEEKSSSVPAMPGAGMDY